MAKPDIIFEDNWLIIVNKPAGLPVLPERWQPNCQSLLAWLIQTRPSALAAHRLDKETSGLVIFAKDRLSNRRLQAAFERRQVQKLYRAITWGRADWETAVCDLPLLANGNRQHQTIVSHRHGKPSLTRFWRLHNWGPCALLEVKPETGRTHQIRVHAKELGLPLVGDSLYGGKTLYLSQVKRHYRASQNQERPLLGRLALHAAQLDFRHPISGEQVHFESADPADFGAALRQLETLA